MGLIEKVDNRNYIDFLSSEKSVLILGSEECPDCKAYKIIVESAAKVSDKRRLGVKFGEIVLNGNYCLDGVLKSYEKKIERGLPVTLIFRKGYSAFCSNSIMGYEIFREKIETFLDAQI